MKFVLGGNVLSVIQFLFRLSTMTLTIDFLLFVLLLCLGGATSSCPAEFEPDRNDPSVCYRRFDGYDTWINARQTCNDAGGHLPILKTEATINHVKAFSSKEGFLKLVTVLSET